MEAAFIGFLADGMLARRRPVLKVLSARFFTSFPASIGTARPADHDAANLMLYAQRECGRMRFQQYRLRRRSPQRHRGHAFPDPLPPKLGRLARPFRPLKASERSPAQRRRRLSTRTPEAAPTPTSSSRRTFAPGPTTGRSTATAASTARTAVAVVAAPECAQVRVDRRVAERVAVRNPSQRISAQLHSRIERWRKRTGSFASRPRGPILPFLSLVPSLPSPHPLSHPVAGSSGPRAP